MKRALLIVLFAVPPLLLSGQQSDSATTAGQDGDTISPYHLLRLATFDGMTFPLVELGEVVVTDRMPRWARVDYRRHARLVYNIRRVYPFALIVRQEFGRINRVLEILPNDQARRNFLKQYEKELLEKYEGDMRKLTFTQGKILIKLIDRETQNTSYELIRQYRGGFTAVFWQGVARIFGANLKTVYDPAGEDYLIEQILIEIEAGRL